MKIQELKENEPLEVIEVSNHMSMPYFHTKEKKVKVIEHTQIQMRIFTDGEIEKESEETSERIKEYYIGKRKYPCYVDTLKTKNIFIKNHSYVITYLIAQEWMNVCNIRGWFDVVKDISVYLENSKDKQALKTAKQAIKQIQKHNNRVDYSSLFTMLSTRGGDIDKFETKRVSKNVYSLRKTRN